MSTQNNPGAPNVGPGGMPVGGEVKDRETEFTATTGGPEVKSGEVLLVQAYVAIWLLLFGYLALLWRRQRSLHDRLDAMDKVLDRAIAAGGASTSKPDAAS